MSSKSILKKCSLCHNVKKLCKSHLISELFYKETYEKGSEKLNVIPLANSNRKFKTIQQGMNMDLLCEDCEGKFNRYETYYANLIKAQSIWDSGTVIYDSDGIEGRSITGLDYYKIKYLMLSIIWRLSFQYSGEKLLDLGLYQEKLRDILLNEKDIKEFDYPVYFQHITLAGNPFNIIGSGGFHRNKKGKRNHLIFLNDLALFATIGEDSADELEQEISLKRDGSCIMVSSDFHSSNLFEVYQNAIKKHSAKIHKNDAVKESI